MQKDKDNLAWSIYWAEDRLQSCVASEGDVDQQALNSIWQDFAGGLAVNARVLDLASGNGAVPVALLSVQNKLQIDAVDQASIDPGQFVKGHAELEAVDFHADTDINNLPFPADSFDALTSQFGIEYAGLFEATRKALELLKPNGHISFLIHHADSAIIKSSRAKILEMEKLLEDDGIVETLMEVLRSNTPFSELESKGEHYLNDDIVRTEAISGQIFNAIGEIANMMPRDMTQAVNLGATLKLRLSSEFERLRQMDSAAQSEADMLEYRELLELNGIEIKIMRQVFADENDQDYLLAWLVQGLKSAA